MLAPVLDFIEHEDTAEGVNMEMMEEACRTQGWMVEDLDRLSELLWGFLNRCLKSEAKESFEEADELDGFNAWRLVIRSIRKSAYIHLATARRLVKYTPPIGSLEEIPAAIKRFDAVHKDFKLSGGTPSSDSEKKTDLLESLPKEIREQLQWRAATPESYDKFRDYLRGQADSMIYHRQGAGKTRWVNLLDQVAAMPELQSSPCGGTTEVLDELPAFMKEFG